MEKIYLEKLHELKTIMNSKKNTTFYAYAKVISLMFMNMKYESIAFYNNSIDKHIYILVTQLIEDTIELFKKFDDINFISNKELLKDNKSYIKEEKHMKLFNTIWDKYTPEEFKSYIKRYEHRIKHNKIESLIKNKKCVDFGCGNGVFCFALLNLGANYVCGIDYGEQSIRYANQYKDENNLNACFKVATVYETGLSDDEFDFAIQNGVFHHLDNENKAINEIKRVLKVGGWMWYYTDGSGAISMDLWDTSVEILKDIDDEFMRVVFEQMGINRNKITHLLDGLNATYRHTTWEEITNRLKRFGFDNFKRLSGGFNTDFDLDVIEKSPYGKEKFGEGDLRILCQLVNK